MGHADRTAEYAGHSLRILIKTYRHAVAHEEAEKFWAIHPSRENGNRRRRRSLSEPCWLADSPISICPRKRNGRSSSNFEALEEKLGGRRPDEKSSNGGAVGAWLQVPKHPSISGRLSNALRRGARRAKDLPANLVAYTTRSRNDF